MEQGSGWAVGKLAESSGLTVRTLHHWEALGLLVSSRRSVAGHRRYSDADIERLYRICSLRQLGLSLSEIGVALDTVDWDLRSTISTQLADVERRLDITQRLRSRLIRLLGTASSTDPPPTTDVLDVLDDMTMMDNPIQRRISILVYRDLQLVFEHLTTVFGLGPGEVVRDGEGNAAVRVPRVQRTRPRRWPLVVHEDHGLSMPPLDSGTNPQTCDLLITGARILDLATPGSVIRPRCRHRRLDDHCGDPVD